MDNVFIAKFGGIILFDCKVVLYLVIEYEIVKHLLAVLSNI